MWNKISEEFLRNKKYLLDGETVKDRLDSICAVIKQYETPYSEGLSERFREYLDKQYVSLSTPQLSNVGRKRKQGKKTMPLPCSCNILTVGDSIADIKYSDGEVAMLSKLGAGVGIDFNGVSEIYTSLDEGFQSNPKLDWVEDLVRTSQKVSQGATRRGYSVPFDSILSDEFDQEALKAKGVWTEGKDGLKGYMERLDKNNPDKNDPLINNNMGFLLPTGFREQVRSGNKEYQRRFLKLLQKRQAVGRIYLVDEENLNKNQSPVYEKLGHRVLSTNICTEVVTPHYDDKSFACIIMSLNGAHWDHIKENLQIIKDAYMVLDIFVELYIDLTEGVPFLEKARRSAMEKRDIGLGLLGFHDYLQSKMEPFGGLGSRFINKEIFKTIREVGEETTKELAEKLGAPKMCQEAGMVRRNVSLTMVAPNKSTATLMSQTSEGINPFLSNFTLNSLAGIEQVTKNRHLEAILEEKGQNTPEIWNSILKNLGSVQHLDFLSEDEKAVFKTASEISPKDIIDLASDRQQYIDMAQSINLWNRPNYTLKDIYDFHMYAFDKGIKTLYYYYSQAHAALEKNGEAWDSCESCAD